MPITDIKEQYLARSSTSTDKGGITNVRVWRCRGTLADGPSAAREAVLGVAGTSFGGGALKGASAAPMDADGTQYLVTVTYEKAEAPGGQNPATYAENPLDRPAIYEFSDSLNQETWYFDKTPDDGATTETTRKAFKNSAGDPMDVLPSRDMIIGAITITRNQATFSNIKASAVRNKINASDETILGGVYDAETLKCNGISATRVFENGVSFYQVRITIGIDRGFDGEGWNSTQYQDRGGRDKNKKPAPDEAGEPLLYWPLNGEGLFKPNKTDEPAVLSFVSYKTCALMALLSDLA